MLFYKVKDALLQRKRASFTHQKGTFYQAKGHLLECKRRPFKNHMGINLTKQQYELLSVSICIALLLLI